MAAEETEDAGAVAPPAAKGGGIAKSAGIAVGLFVLMLASQLVGPILGCKLMPGLMPGCGVGELSEAGEDAPEEEKKGPPQYLALDPPLVVSFEDRSAIRFLQVTVEMMARDDKVIEAVTTHTPIIRNNLLMLMGGKTVSELTSREGKEALREEALAEVQRILTANFGEPGVEELYFTSFVVQ